METKEKAGLKVVRAGGVPGGKEKDKEFGATEGAAGTLARVVLLLPITGRNGKKVPAGRFQSRLLAGGKAGCNRSASWKASCFPGSRPGRGILVERYRRRLYACKYAVLLPWIPLVIYARCYSRPGELQSLHLPGMDSPLMLSYLVCMAALLVAVYLHFKSERVA